MRIIDSHGDIKDPSWTAPYVLWADSLSSRELSGDVEISHFRSSFRKRPCSRVPKCGGLLDSPLSPEALISIHWPYWRRSKRCLEAGTGVTESMPRSDSVEVCPCTDLVSRHFLSNRLGASCPLARSKAHLSHLLSTNVTTNIAEDTIHWGLAVFSRWQHGTPSGATAETLSNSRSSASFSMHLRITLSRRVLPVRLCIQSKGWLLVSRETAGPEQ